MINPRASSLHSLRIIRADLAASEVGGPQAKRGGKWHATGFHKAGEIAAGNRKAMIQRGDTARDADKINRIEKKVPT